MIEDGSSVTLHYTLTVNGDLVDTSRGREPLTYVQGAGQIVKGLEAHLSGMSEGEAASLSVPPELGYGEKDPEAFVEVSKEAFEDLDKVAVGTMLQGRDGKGNPFSARVDKIGDEVIRLDLNHPLAGRTLEFEVEILKIA